MRAQMFPTGTIVVAGALAILTVFSTPGVKAGPRQLVLQVHSVQCKDETTGKWREKLGVDTIALGGITIDPASNVKRFPTWRVGEFKKDGVQKTYSTPHQLLALPFQAKLPFPQTFRVVLVLAELDPGNGFDKQLDKIAAAGSRAGMDKAKSMLGVGLDASIKQAESGEPKPIQVYAAEIGKAILKVKSEEWWQDDLFPPLNQQFSVTGPDFRFPNGKLEGPRQTLIFTGGRIQGKYAVTYSWRVI